MPGIAAHQSLLVDLTRDSPPPDLTYLGTLTSQRRPVIRTPVIHRPKPRRWYDKLLASDDPDDPIETFSDEEPDLRAKECNRSRARRACQRVLADQFAEKHLARPSRRRQRSASPRYLNCRGDKENRPLRERQAGAPSPPVMEQQVIAEQQRAGIWAEHLVDTYDGKQSRRGRQPDALGTPDARKRPRVKGSGHASPFQPGANTMDSLHSSSGRAAHLQSAQPTLSTSQHRMSFGSGSYSSAPRGQPSPAQIHASRQGPSTVKLAMRDPEMSPMIWHRSSTSRLSVQGTTTLHSSGKGKQPMRQLEQEAPFEVPDDDDEDIEDEALVSPLTNMTPHHPSAIAAGSSSARPASATRPPKNPIETHAGPSTTQNSSPTRAVASARKRPRNHVEDADRPTQLDQRTVSPRAGPSTLRNARRDEPSLAREEDDGDEISFIEHRKSPERPATTLGGFSAASDDVQLLEILPGERSSRRPAAPSPSAGIPSSSLGLKSIQIRVLKPWVNGYLLDGTLTLKLDIEEQQILFDLFSRSAEQQCKLLLKGSDLTKVRTCRNEEHPMIALHADLRANTLAGEVFSEGCRGPTDERHLKRKLANQPETDMSCFLPPGPEAVQFIDVFSKTFKSPAKVWPLEDKQCNEVFSALYQYLPRSRGGPGLQRGSIRADDNLRSPSDEFGQTRHGRGSHKRQPLTGPEPLPGSLRAERRAGPGTAETQGKLDFTPKPKSQAGEDSSANQADTETSRGTRESRRLKDKPPKRYDDAGEDGDAASTEVEPAPRARKHPPPANRDLLLFPWPLSGRAELNITAGDRYRVVDDDFLNDTMIEFGIRHAIDQQPEAPKPDEGVTRPPVWTTPAKIVLEDRTTYREEVAMLSSFFLEKLGKKKLPASVDDSWAGYNAVKRWTRNKNMFEKKMIIVPVNENFHWYLAVIINPRGVLRDAAGAKKAEPAADDSSTVPAIAAPEKASDAGSDPSRASSPLTPDRSPLGGFAQQRNLSKPSSPSGSEQDVEDVVMAGDGDAQMAEIDHSDPMNLTDATDDVGLDDGESRPAALNNKMRRLSMTASPSVTATVPSSPPAPLFGAWHDMEAQRKEELLALTEPTLAEDEAAKASKSEDTPAATATKPEGSKGRTAPGIAVEGVEDCLIFTLDSLGGAHKDVGNCLTKWLLFEARDKLPEYKGGLTEAVYKEVKVPQQTNMSDCGLYLIHYVQQLIQRPKEIFKFIERPRPYAGRADHAAYMDETKKTWRNAETGSLRDHWAATIDSLASEYKRQQNGGQDEKRDSPPKADDRAAVAEAEPTAPVADPVVATQTSIEEIVPAESHVPPETSSAAPIDALETGHAFSEEEEEHIEVRDVRPETPPLEEMPTDVESVQESVPVRSSSEPLEGELSIDMSAASDGPDIVPVSASPEETKGNQRQSQPVEPPVRSLKDRLDKRQPSSAAPPAAESQAGVSAAVASGRRARPVETGGRRMLGMAISAANQGLNGIGRSSRRSSRSPIKSDTESWAELTRSKHISSPVLAHKPVEEEDSEMLESLESDVAGKREDQVLVPATQAKASSPNAGEVHLFDNSTRSENVPSTQSHRLFGSTTSRTWPETLLKSTDTGDQDVRMSEEDRGTGEHATLASRFTSAPTLDLSGNPLNSQSQPSLSIKGKGKAPAPQPRPKESMLSAGLRAVAGRTISDTPSRHKLTTAAGVVPDDDDSDDSTESPKAAFPLSSTSLSLPVEPDAIYVDDGQEEADIVGDDGVTNGPIREPSPRKQPTQYSRKRANGGGRNLDTAARRRVLSDASTVSAAKISSSEDESERNGHRASPATLRQTTLPGSGTPRKGRKRRGNAAAAVEPDSKKSKRSGGKSGGQLGSVRTGGHAVGRGSAPGKDKVGSSRTNAINITDISDNSD